MPVSSSRRALFFNIINGLQVKRNRHTAQVPVIITTLLRNLLLDDASYCVSTQHVA